MKFYGELLIFVLLFVINLRVFFVNSVKRDPLVAFAPITFILSIFQIFSWGVDLFTILGVVLSLLVLLSNFHALFRYSERLYVDHYSVLMKVWAIFTDVLSISAIICLIIFAPLEVKKDPFNVKETKTRYSGTFASGFEESKAFERVSAILYEYEKSEEKKQLHGQNVVDGAGVEVDAQLGNADAQVVGADGKTDAQLGNTDAQVVEADGNADVQVVGADEQANVQVVEENHPEKTKNIVLFVPDKRGDTYNYEPYLKLLASSSHDFIVISCDFFAKDCKWFYSPSDSKIIRNFAMIIHSIKNHHNFLASRELYTYNISRECEQLLIMINEKYGENFKIFAVSDGMSNNGVADFAKKHPSIVTGHFKLDSIPEYKSSGYGFIAETNPMLNSYLGLPRERNFETPKLLAEKTMEIMKF